MDNKEDLINIEDQIKHQFGMMIAGTIAGFIASGAARKIYKVAVEGYKAQKNQDIITEVN